jgi:hypothetical protein
MRRFVLACALLSVLPGAALVPFRAEAQPAAGIYDMAGTNPNGSPYTGLVLLADRGSGAFQVEWNVSGQRISGWAVAQGDALAASYVLDGRIGVVLYRRAGDAWRGVWSVSGAGAGTETLTRR